MIGTRKRNGREKSYDSYNQKLQLPPMIKTPLDRSDRTYSVPNQGQIGAGGGKGQHNQGGGNATNSQTRDGPGSSSINHHQYMLPLTPNRQ